MAPPIQKTFTLVPQAPAVHVPATTTYHAVRPMTSKQVQKAYKEKNREPRMSRAERIKKERAEQDRIRKEFEKEKAAAKAKLARERKKDKEESEKQEKKRRGMPTVKVRPSQDLIVGFIRGKKRDCKGDVKERKVEVVQEAVEGDVTDAPPIRKRGECDTITMEKPCKNGDDEQTNTRPEGTQRQNPAISFDEGLFLDDDELELEIRPEKASPVKSLQQSPKISPDVPPEQTREQQPILSNQDEQFKKRGSQRAQQDRLPCNEKDTDILQALAEFPNDMDDKSDISPDVFDASDGLLDDLRVCEALGELETINPTEPYSRLPMESNSPKPRVNSVSETLPHIERSPQPSKSLGQYQPVQPSPDPPSAPKNPYTSHAPTAHTRTTPLQMPDLASGSAVNRPGHSSPQLGAMGPPPLPATTSKRPPPDAFPMSTQAILGSFDDFFPSSTQQALELEDVDDLHISLSGSSQFEELYVPVAEAITKDLPPQAEIVNTPVDACPSRSPTPSPPVRSQARFFTSSGNNERFHVAIQRSIRDANLQEIRNRDQERLRAGTALLQRQESAPVKVHAEAAKSRLPGKAVGPTAAAPRRERYPLTTQAASSGKRGQVSHIETKPCFPQARNAPAAAGKENINPSASKQQGDDMFALSQETDYGGGWMDDEAVDSLIL